MRTSRTQLLIVVCTLLLTGTGMRPDALGQADRQAAPKSKDGRRLLSALDVLRINNVGAPALSPDGKRVAYTVTETLMPKDKVWSTATQVWVVPAGGGEARQFTRGDRSASGPDWSPDGKHLAFLTDREKEGERQVYFMWDDGGEAWKITDHKGGVSSFRFSPDSRSILFTAADQPDKEEEQRKKDRDDAIEVDRDHKMTHIWVFDLATMKERRLTEGDFNCSDPHWSPDGKRISFTTTPTPKADDAGLSDIWIVSAATGEKKLLVENPGADSGARWSPDGKSIAYVGNKDARGGISQNHLFVVSPDGGAPRKLTESFELDAGTPSWTSNGKTILFTSNSRQDIQLYATDVATGRVQQLSRHHGTLSLSDIDAVGGTLVGTVSTSETPSEIYLADGDINSMKILTHHNAWLKDYALGGVEILRWKSKDGLEIEGLLTKPVDFDPTRKYPLLLNPHGGPTGASMAGFNGSTQLFAANGYLVLQPNFRGSTGRGEQFAGANKDSWGKGDYEDCMTGVDAAIAQGYADPDRLGAFGWSYGGYMTFWILTQTDRFKAVSPGAGLTNIYSMYSQNDIQRYLRWFYGDKAPWDNVDLYWDRSPMKYVKQVKTPAMILHGQMDTRVPLAQAQEFYRALYEQNIPVDFVVYPREGHGFREPRHNLDRMRRYLTFFGKYLGNPPITEESSHGSSPQSR